jgi:predicted ATPase
MAGFFLDDCPEFETWLVSQQEEWRRRVTVVLEKLIGAYAHQDQDDQAEFYARRWLAVEPWRERAHRYLMALLARNGQRSAALAQYETCRRVLADELAAEPGAEIATLYEQIRTGQFGKEVEPHRDRDVAAQERRSKIPAVARPASTPVPASALRVPAPSTPFINRTAELSQLFQFLQDPDYRLITVIGAGGIGKTRLALQATLQLVEQGPPSDVGDLARPAEFEHGIYFVPLSSLSSAEFLVSAIAEALNFSFYSGADQTSQLLNYLREKQLLLILDNFDHLLAGADLLVDILTYAPAVKIVVASRERLNLQEEYLLPLRGMSIPSNGTGQKEKLAKVLEEYSAVQLFLQHARTVNPNFVPSETEQASVIRICQLLDGIPLAIELAAAWVRLLSCREIAREIERNLDFLSTSLRNVPPRHRSLRAVFDYSWQFLSAEEKRVFRQLAVFRGGFQREAAERVVETNLATLLALVDKSLLRRSDQDRFDLHAVLGQYAAEKLNEAPQERAGVQERHCDYYAAFLQQRKALLEGNKQKEALLEISVEIEAIRAGWRWAIDRGKIKAIDESLDGLFHFYDMRSWFQEGAEAFGYAARQLVGASSRGGGADEPAADGQTVSLDRQEAAQAASHPVTRNLAEPATPVFLPQVQSLDPTFQLVLAKILARQGWFTFQSGQHEPAKAMLQESLAILHHLKAVPDSQRALIFSLNYLGAVHRHLGAYTSAEHYLRESISLGRAIGDQFGLSIALNILSQVAYLQGNYMQARQFGQESLAIKRTIGDRRGMAFSLINLGRVALTLSEYRQAKEHFEESLAINREIDDPRSSALCLNYLGEVALVLEEYDVAQRLNQESLATFREIGNQWGIISALTGLGRVAAAVGQYPAANATFADALKLAMEIEATPLAMEVLLGMAGLLIKTNQSDRALDILELVLKHPASSRDTQDKAAHLLTELEPQRPAEAIKKPGATNQIKTLESVVEALLQSRTD